MSGYYAPSAISIQLWLSWPVSPPYRGQKGKKCFLLTDESVRKWPHTVRCKAVQLSNRMQVTRDVGSALRAATTRHFVTPDTCLLPNNYHRDNCVTAQRLRVRCWGQGLGLPELHYFDLLWICCGDLSWSCCGLAGRQVVQRIPQQIEVIEFGAPVLGFRVRVRASSVGWQSSWPHAMLATCHFDASN